MARVLVTGAVGFIGFHLSKALLENGHDVIGVDNVNSYYDPSLKEARLANIESMLAPSQSFHFYREDITDKAALNAVFQNHEPEIVVNLAAQAGVRYSIEAPQQYIDTNVSGFQNILDACKDYKVKHLLYASSSSVYGNSRTTPFLSSDPVDHPVSMYAATKRMNELMAHVYSNMFGINTTGLRFFTVYGPWGRPDMAPMKFAKSIMEGMPIDVYNNGQHWRDFTYIDDIVNGIMGLLDTLPKPSTQERPNTAEAPFEIFNIGAKKPVHLLSFIECMEVNLGKKAIKNMLPMQPGDVSSTYADVTPLHEKTGYTPTTPLDEGVKRFVNWYNEYYK
ncbi:MAG: capsular biosynthesis protein CpsI [Gammaproteobacteria bacterium TMED95]|uniref:Capsular biosynthesis protein CpsI n=1 Tax=Alteromonas mediterranea TaxID=314275 RepID=A0AAC9NTX6_9ALTE|nr:NAD-dependent epimerase/dehydratase family protein [Alteromonas mediterranea]APD92389.1 capsular biosynthesis protein CpsI [Alteromonas mediterranea]APE00250.1 capsular biosynthesis protein CpsI [Alteromonas mediterranea]OUV22176.1 MAG: capsular biosynthesis protein CpsI [Gammaproteobacteria bacterium TMED95]|tara:strand:- start:3085 stop:4089 length:1005 start_codon:yes stop_codon:yes gene_type:complete